MGARLPYAPSRARTSASDGFVVADPSGKTTVGTVRFPALTRSTYSAASSWCSTSTSVHSRKGPAAVGVGAA